MASSDYDTYMKLSAHSVRLSEDGMKIHNNNDDTQSVTLKATPSQAGNVDITLPVAQAGALLADFSDLDARNLKHANLLAAVTPADTDHFMLTDASDGESIKACTGSALKAYCSTALSPGDIDNSNLFAPGVVDANALAAGAVESSKIAANAVDNAAIAANAVDSGKLAAGAVNAAALGAGAVESAKIAAGAVDSAALGAGAVDSSKLAAGAVDSAAIAANAVNTAAIGPGQVTAAKVATDAITTGKIQNDAVTSDKLAAAVALDTSVEAPVFYFGNNKWKAEVDGSNDLKFYFWNGTSWVDKGGYAS